MTLKNQKLLKKLKKNINKKQDNEQQSSCNLNTLLSNNMIEKNIKNKINYIKKYIAL